MKFISNLLLSMLIAVSLSCTETEMGPINRKIDFIEIINPKDDPQLTKLIADLYNNKTNPTGRSLSTDFGELNLESALKLNDTIFNRTRYSLAINQDTGSLVFENLIISVREEGVFHYILQYQPDSLWVVKNQGIPNWSKFTGSIQQFDMGRQLVAEVYLENGVSADKKPSNGRIEECCTWKISEVGATFGQILDIDCGKGGSYTLYTMRTNDCGGGGGDGGGSSGGSFGGGDGGGGYTGDGGGGYGGGSDYYGGGGAGSGTSTDDQSGYSNPIPIYPIVDLYLDETWEEYIENIQDPETKRKAQLGYIKKMGGEEGKSFALMIEEIINTDGLTVGDVYEINMVVNNYYLSLKGQYMIAIFYPVAETAKFIIELALIETGTTVFFNSVKVVLNTRYGIVATRIVASVIKTSQELINSIKAELRFGLNNASMEVTIGARTLTGLANKSKTAYNFTGVSQAEAKSLFDKLTSSANVTKVDIPSKGSVWRASLGDKQMIQFRNFSSTNAGEATIEFKIESISGSQVIELKFFP